MRWLTITLALGVASAASNITCTGIQAVSAACRSSESAMVRDFFYIGGEYVYESTYNSSIYSDQMYVEKLTLATGSNQTYPIVLINAGVPSGAVRYTLSPMVCRTASKCAAASGGVSPLKSTPLIGIYSAGMAQHTRQSQRLGFLLR